jgi:hypothetical protein
MQVIKGNLWDELGRADYIFVTTNSVLNRYGDLVMGKGAAQQAKLLAPMMPEDLGRLMRDLNVVGEKYGILNSNQIVVHRGKETRLCAFQTKYNWKCPSDLELIRWSTMMLSTQARTFDTKRFALNFPGIGEGGLPEDVVLPIIEALPDNVYVYKR